MRYIIGIYLFLAACSQPQPIEVNLIPKPQSLEIKEGVFVLNHSTGIEVDERFRKELSYFQSLTGLSLNGEKNKLIFRNQENYSILPEWHPASGSLSWIFVDEVLIQ